MKSLIILGRQPEIGIAELESLCGSESLTIIGRAGVLVDKESHDIPFAQMGGSVKIAHVLTMIDTVHWDDIETQLHSSIPGIVSNMPEGKIRVGVSVYGIHIRTADINAAGLRLKKTIKQTGRSVRVVPNKQPELNSAQVIHNQLDGKVGCEFVVARFNQKTVIARTVYEQDIESYSRRDQNRPMRDAKVGMLPPKLAQILINLAKPQPAQMILDPFCGTGVVLQEALLMGLRAYGTDIDKRMVDYSIGNIKWLENSYKIIGIPRIEVGDATIHSWSGPIDAVVGETYLGKPLSSLPPRTVLDTIIRECEEIHNKFLKNIAPQLQPGTRLSLAVPAWRTKNSFIHLKVLDHLEELGYNRISFVHVRNTELIYHRPDQTVARELVVLEKK